MCCIFHSDITPILVSFIRLNYIVNTFATFYGYINGPCCLDDDEDAVNCEPPSEKERRNMVIVVSCVGLVITILAATMVGITLGLSHMIEEPDVFPGRNISGKDM